MKKLMFLCCVLALVAAPSCKKTYTCSCAGAGNLDGYTPVSTSFAETNKSEAMTDCSNWQTEQQFNVIAIGGNGTVTCSL